MFIYFPFQIIHISVNIIFKIRYMLIGKYIFIFLLKPYCHKLI